MTALAEPRLLAPISLPELVERAALLHRVDRKYVVPVEVAHGLGDVVPVDTRVLEIGGRRRFSYRSVYLDTPDYQSFHVSGRSRRRRWKVRSREYVDTGTSWLEVKTRAARGVTLKQRIEHPDAEASGLTPEGLEFVGSIIGTEVASVLRPVLVTRYDRTTFFLPASSSRTTIDVDLGWTSLRTQGDLHRRARAIVETKTGSTPSEVDRLLWARGYRPVRISKFGVGLAALHPDLPRLKWHRALTKHLNQDPLSRRQP